MLYNGWGIDLFPCKYTKWERWFAWYPVVIKDEQIIAVGRGYLFSARRVWLKKLWRRRNLTFDQWEYTIDDIFWQLKNLQ